MKLRRPLVSLAAISLAATLVGVIWVNRDRFTPLDVGSVAPDYEAYSLAGDTVALSSLGGNLLLLNVWATWCAPCVREMPALQRLHETMHADGLRIVAVSVDAAAGEYGPFGQPGGDVAEFVERFALTFPVLHDPRGGIQAAYQVGGLPTTFLIGRDGRIRRKVLGAADWDRPPLVDEIRRMLEG